jgi:hypothetical protein
MRVRFSDNNKAGIHMGSYLEEAISESNLDLQREASTPATKTLFDIDHDSKPVSVSKSNVFHRAVAKNLYVATRARLDILPTLTFLCTRVSKCTLQDQIKLIEYIKATIGLEHTIAADNLGSMRLWVDASYAVHQDMGSQTGGVLSFGTGRLLGKSTRKKLNINSSTKAELVGASEYLPYTMWVKFFIEAQGHSNSECKFEQDIESAIKLETNGRSSAGTKSRHINICSFWIQDVTEANDIKILHCRC